jgi:glycosyltransferase involved in cell wall biosynthesis
VRGGKYDAVVCHSPWSQAMFGGVAPRVRVPAVFWLHEAVEGKFWLERWAMRNRPSFCIANSHYSKSTLGFLYRDIPSEVVYCPVDFAPVRLDESERAELRRELGASAETALVVQTSRMQPLKGQKRLLRALARLPADARVLCLQIGGPQRPEEEAYFEELQTEARELGVTGRVRFLGQRADVLRLLAAADIYCQPNFGVDSFGLAFIEALAAGLPVVASDLGGPREIVTPDVGFLVGDDGALTDALERLIGDPELRRRLGAHGPERAKALCDPKARLSDMARVLAGAARQARSAEAAA